MAQNPHWENDELLLALDLYIHEPEARNKKSHQAIAELSALLRRLPLHTDPPDPKRFRNTNSVYLKLQNFKAVDVAYTRAGRTGLAAGAGARERAVWRRFASHPAELRRTAEAIRDAAHSSSHEPSPDEPEDGGVLEGRILLGLHRRRERQSAAKKKQQVLKLKGALACEACGFDFAVIYGALGTGFAECHHTLPLTEGARLTRLEDLAIVCANCHRMLHRHSPPLIVSELRALVGRPATA